MQKTIKNLKEMKDFAKVFLKNNKKQVILLNGDLGAGKTAFVQAIGANLKIKEKINSPTFVISKKYKISKGFLIHIDAYRLTNKNDLKNIGLLEQLKNNQNLIFIEWGNIIEKFLPVEILKKNTQKINFEYLDKNKRKLVFHK